ncbi:MAG: hypothetical protein DHS20C08_04090 [Rhodomicrobium sp.]|nr:MAG: hypothetical protein DHS20C08_04090 [Rhodomicrobium sp.]
MKWLVYCVCLLTGGFIANYTAKHYSNPINEGYEVVMFSTSLCDYCAIFNEEIGKPYAENELSKKAPLIRVNLDEYGTGPYHLKKPLQYAPTFVIMSGDKEIARMRGHMDRFTFLAFVRDTVYPLNQVAFSWGNP